jgi:hypothetical protein
MIQMSYMYIQGVFFLVGKNRQWNSVMQPQHKLATIIPQWHTSVPMMTCIMEDTNKNDKNMYLLLK